MDKKQGILNPVKADYDLLLSHYQGLCDFIGENGLWEKYWNKAGDQQRKAIEQMRGKPN